MSKHEHDIDLIRQLAALLKESDLGELEYEADDRRIRLAKPAPAMVAAQMPMQMAAAAMAPAANGVAAPAPADDAGNPGAVKSPMVGTAYLSPEPGKPVFVAVGDKVAAGQTLLIIEAMKTFNPIKAPKAGTVAKIIISNAQPVEFGQPLMIVE